MKTLLQLKVRRYDSRSGNLVRDDFYSNEVKDLAWEGNSGTAYWLTEDLNPEVRNARLAELKSSESVLDAYLEFGWNYHVQADVEIENGEVIEIRCRIRNVDEKGTSSQEVVHCFDKERGSTYNMRSNDGSYHEDFDRTIATLTWSKFAFTKVIERAGELRNMEAN